MTEKMRDRLWGGFIGTTSAIAASVVLLWINSTFLKGQEQRDLINSKVDQVEFEKFKKENTEEHIELQKAQLAIKKEQKAEVLLMESRLKQHIDTRIDDTQTLIIQLSKQKRNSSD